MTTFVYFYSPLYEYYHNHITATLKDYFTLDPIVIQDLKPNQGHTFWGGVSIKIELVLKKIEEHFGKTILFSDATIFLNAKTAHQLNDFIETYKDHDLCFADNMDSSCNIGFILIQCNTMTYKFFKTVLNDLVTQKGWDQVVVNHHVQHSAKDMKVGMFNNEKIICGWSFPEKHRETFLLYKSFIGHSNDGIENFNRRLHVLKNSGLIAEDEFVKYKK